MGAYWRRLYRLLTSPMERKVWRLDRERNEGLAKADLVVVSFPKSGKTWLRALITRLYQQRYHLPDGVLIAQDNLHRLNPAIPNIFFSHACNPLGSVDDLRSDRGEFRGRKVAFLMRHPCDVAVSHYYQLKHRKAGKRENATRGLGLFDYIVQPKRGLEYIIAYTNGWWRFVQGNPDACIVRYEELMNSPETALKRLFALIGTSFDDREIAEAVEFCSFAKLQQREREGYYNDKALRPADPDDPNSFKVRRGKIGGYRQDMTEQQAATAESIVRAQLDPAIGY